MLAAEGAIAFPERVSPALERVDSSSGSIGTAVNNAIAELVPIIADAPADAKTREAWLERLFEAYQDDGIPYIEWLGDHWGTLCASKEIASAWADRLMETVKLAWSPDPSLRGFFKGTTNCLSALVAAERYDDVLALLELELAPYKMWRYRQYGVKDLAARRDDLIVRDTLADTHRRDNELRAFLSGDETERERGRQQRWRAVEIVEREAVSTFEPDPQTTEPAPAIDVRADVGSQGTMRALNVGSPIVGQVQEHAQPTKNDGRRRGTRCVRRVQHRSGSEPSRRNPRYEGAEVRDAAAVMVDPDVPTSRH